MKFNYIGYWAPIPWVVLLFCLIDLYFLHKCIVWFQSRTFFNSPSFTLFIYVFCYLISFLSIFYLNLYWSYNIIMMPNEVLKQSLLYLSNHVRWQHVHISLDLLRCCSSVPSSSLAYNYFLTFAVSFHQLNFISLCECLNELQIPVRKNNIKFCCVLLTLLIFIYIHFFLAPQNFQQWMSECLVLMNVFDREG